MEIFEILDAVNEAQTREEKMKILGDNDCLSLRDIMKINFDKNITIHVSKNINWLSKDTHDTNLKDITKYLVPLSKGTIEQGRADASFKSMLERIHPADAVYLEQAAHKKLKVKGLTEKLIKSVWGDKIL
jgi:hypothetical protein